MPAKRRLADQASEVVDRPGGQNDHDGGDRDPGQAGDVWPGPSKKRLVGVERRQRFDLDRRCRGRCRRWQYGADRWDGARELLGGGARGIGGRLVVVSEKELVDSGADRCLLDHRAAADLAAYPAGPELPRLILSDHEHLI